MKRRNVMKDRIGESSVNDRSKKDNGSKKDPNYLQRLRERNYLFTGEGAHGSPSHSADGSGSRSEDIASEKITSHQTSDVRDHSQMTHYPADQSSDPRESDYPVTDLLIKASEVSTEEYMKAWKKLSSNE
jgi:hypothetical protein